MRIDPVPVVLPDPPVTPARDNNPLVGVEARVHKDSANIPVPAPAVVQTETEGAKPQSSPDRGETAWNDEPACQVYRVVDSSGRVVYQIPSQQVLEVAKQIDSTLKESELQRSLDSRL